MHKAILTLTILTALTSCRVGGHPPGLVYDTAVADVTFEDSRDSIDIDPIFFVDTFTFEVFYEGVLVEDLSLDEDGDGLTAMVDCNDRDAEDTMSLDDPDCVDLRICDI